MQLYIDTSLFKENDALVKNAKKVAKWRFREFTAYPWLWSLWWYKIKGTKNNFLHKISWAKVYLSTY